MFGFDLRTVLAHGIALHVNTKFVPVLILPMQSEGNGQGDALRATALFTAKVQ
jgi:hypothetical protein